MTAPQRLTDRKREAIVAAAIAEFRVNGFEVTSMDKIAATAKKRADAIAKRREPVTGVSEFPNVAEGAAAVMTIDPPKARSAEAVEEVARFEPRPLGEAYEHLRDRADAAASRPTIFLANLGRIADFTARATWSKNFFEAGGIRAVTNDGFASLDDLDRKSVV